MGPGFHPRLTMVPAEWLLAGIVVAVLVMALPNLAGPAATPEQEGAEVWEAKCLGSTAVAYVHRNGTALSGVLYLTSLMGQTDVYHFKGAIVDGQINAAHYTGHKFEGRLVSDQEATGVVTTRHGYHLTITSRRIPADQSSP